MEKDEFSLLHKAFMNESIYEIVIIGGGASGLMFAAQCDLDGASGVLLEGGSSPGKKLLMSGGGHCNITHGGPIKDFINAYGGGGQALRQCLYKHSNIELAGWLESHGIELTDENGEPVYAYYGSESMESAGRIFPASMKSKDVLGALLEEAELNGWQIETDTKVCGLRRKDTWEITLANDWELRAYNIVVASGGITYPETGSDGSMFELLGDLGIEINEPRPALAPIYVEGYPYADLAGVSLHDITAVALNSKLSTANNGKSPRRRGDLLFTHEGLSGPVILNISKYLGPGGCIRLCYNREMQDLPKRMQKILRDRCRGPLGDVRTKELAALLSRDDFTVSRVDERGMVTAGGVSLDGIDAMTMQSNAIDSLYVIGEALDADGITGGYNLQMCWSTAGVAADRLKKSLK